MSKKADRKILADKLFLRSSEHSENGNHRAAFRLILAAAKLGDRSAQLNVGYFYDTGRGVKRNKTLAIRWYKRAYRRGDASAAHNLGTIWRDKNNVRRALYWFQRAIALSGGDDGDATLEIAKLYLREGNRRSAVIHLRRTVKSQRGTESSAEEAKKLLRELKKASRK